MLYIKRFTNDSKLLRRCFIWQVTVIPDPD